MRTFDHGIHPKEYKSLTSSRPIEALPLPQEVYIPLQQHIGRECIPIVQKKDEVKTGQMIGKATGFISSPVHSSITGVVKDIGFYMQSQGVRSHMILIQRSEEEQWQLLDRPKNWEQASSDELNTLIFNAGIVGMGGAGFPSHVKFNVPPERPLDSFILNGCECEPFMTCDHRIMLERTEKMLLGMVIIMKILGVKKGFIGIENNKKDAIKKINRLVKAGSYPVRVIPLKVKYPQGGEKLLIKAILNRKVPAGSLPGDIGVIVSNVGTAHAIMEAVIEGKPSISRVITVSGQGVISPANLEARIGTPLKNLIEFCDGLKDSNNQVIMGGPMMGYSQYDLLVPVVKGTSGVLCTVYHKSRETNPYPCISCNSCVSACPMFLLPNRLVKLVKNELVEESEKTGILVCIECGSCSYVCPSKIPMLQWLQMGKYKVNERKRKSAV